MKTFPIVLIVILLLSACSGQDESSSQPSTIEEESGMAQALVTPEAEAASFEDSDEELADMGVESTTESTDLSQSSNLEETVESIPEIEANDGPSLVSNPGLPGRIIFESVDISGQVPGYLYMMNADGSQLAKLVETPAQYEDINWNPTTRQLGLILWEAGWSGAKVFLLDIDSGDAHEIPSGAVTIEDFEFLPNSDEVVFRGYEKSSATFIYRSDLQTSAIKELSSSLHGHVYFDVSPSGRYVAYNCGPICILDLEEVEDIRFLNQAQDGSWMLTDRNDNKSYAIKPAWAPDGNQLAFVYDDKDGVGQQICTIDVTSEESLCWPISPHIINIGDGSITWSPDSNYIAYDAKDTNKSRGIGATLLGNLFAIDINSGEIVSLTNSLVPHWDASPLWIADDPPFQVPIASSSPFSAALASAGGSDSNPTDMSSLDQLGAADTLQALIQAFADDDRPTFDYLIEGLGFSPREIWEKMGEGCQGIDAAQLTYLDTEDACCTEDVIEFMVLNDQAPTGTFTLHRQSNGIWKIVGGGTNCGG